MVFKARRCCRRTSWRQRNSFPLSSFNGGASSINEHGYDELAWVDHSKISNIKLLVHIGHQTGRVLQWRYEKDYHLWPAANTPTFQNLRDLIVGGGTH